MKKILYPLLLSLPVSAIAQVGMGTTTPDASAQLDVNSTSKGALFPRLTTTQRDAIANPATGLVIFNTTTSAIECNAGTPASPAWSSASTTKSVTLSGSGSYSVGNSASYIVNLGTVTIAFPTASAQYLDRVYRIKLYNTTTLTGTFLSTGGAPVTNPALGNGTYELHCVTNGAGLYLWVFF